MRSLLPYLALYRQEKWLLSLGVLLAIITLLASIGLLTLSGWFLSASALVGMSGVYFNYMLPAAGVRAGAIVRTAGRYCERLVSHDATFRVLEHLRVTTFSKLLPLSPAGLARFRQGELLNRMVADVDTLDHLYLRVISPLTGAFVVILVITLGLSVLDVSLALTLGGIMLATLLFLPPLFYRAGHPVGEALTEQRGQYRLQLTAWLQGHAELTIFGASAAAKEQLEETEIRWQHAQYQQASLTAISQAIMLLISGLAVIMMLWISSAGVGGNTTPGALIALFVFCALAAFEALAPVTGAFQHLGQVIASAKRVTQIINQPPEVIFSEKKQPVAKHVQLAINGLGFTYPNQTHPVLHNVNLSVASGQRVAILGSTGCGKSTLLQLLTRAWDPNTGDITLNNQSVSSLDETCLRASMSIVPQRVHLFSATLRDNLLLAAPDASDEELQSMLDQVDLTKLYADEGLDAWLGEGGRSLSGGELRRLAIARALLHNAPLLLLDEPTEGLDAETEHHILTLLDKLTKGKTVLMVTHRLRGLHQFDNIVIMEAGTVLEQGTHTQLMAKGGRYYQFRQRI